MWESEEARIRRVYRDRDSRGKGELYNPNRPDVQLNQERFRRAAWEMLSRNGYADLSGVTALDAGCGSGGWIRTLIELGAKPENLCGADLLEDRIETAMRLTPGAVFKTASGFSLPWPDACFKLVCANTVFSSIPDGSARMAFAGEMIRVLKPEGAIMIYDFKISDPRNPDTVGIGAGEIVRLFPGFGRISRSLTLAPPISRPLARMSPGLALAVEIMFPFLRTHAIHFLKR